MHNVLFLSHEPTAAPGRAEFYELCLDPLNDEQEQVTHVREIHGWWDNETGRVVVDETQVEQAASFPTFGEALNVFVRRRQFRIDTGFRHLFRWHPLTGAPAFHMELGMMAGPQPAALTDAAPALIRAKRDFTPSIAKRFREERSDASRPQCEPPVSPATPRRAAAVYP